MDHLEDLLLDILMGRDSVALVQEDLDLKME